MASATGPTVHESAKEGDLRTLKKWIDTEGDIDRKFVFLLIMLISLIINVTIIHLIVNYFIL